jgi:hypothetical protein
MVLAWAVPGRACANGSWVRPVAGPVALAYGDTWVDTLGRSCTHGGLDLLGPSGSMVGACGPGEVIFAGLVPAGAGARAYAVTVLTTDGLRVTYLPLTSANVRKGQQVSAGTLVGSLAASGDGSSAASHLHLGVKRGGAPLDPASFLAPPAEVLPPVPVPHTVPHAPGVRSDETPSPRRLPAPQPARGAVLAPKADVTETAVRAVGDAADALALVPPLRRVQLVATPASLDLERAGAELAAGWAAFMSVGVRAGLALLAAGCVALVLRATRKAAARAVPVVVRRGRS